MRTGDPRIRFSACLDMLDAALEALALTDRAAFSAALAALPERAVAEREAYAAFCARRDGALLRASESISDRSLRAAGAGGLASYRALVCYAVGYNFS